MHGYGSESTVYRSRKHGSTNGRMTRNVLAERQAMNEQDVQRTRYQLPECPFCEKAPDDKPVYALEPLNPVVPGHLLFIPANHYRDAGTDPDVTGLVFRAAASYARTTGDDYNMIVNAGQNATQTVEHLHVHYVPRRSGDGLHLPWTGQKAHRDH